MTPILRSLPILVINVHSRCNCRCVMCDIWRRTGAQEWSVDALDYQLSSMEGLGVEWAVLTGGEPLMHSDLAGICGMLRRRNIRITVLSTGLLLARHAGMLAQSVDDVIVSIDGPPDTHDAIRCVRGAYRGLEEGVQTLRAQRKDLPITARSTVQRLNCTVLCETVDAARRLGVDSISFLATDLTSAAFNRLEPWPDSRRADVGLNASDIGRLELEVECLISSGECGRFVVESPDKLRRIVQHFRSNIGAAESIAPVCNAPWCSAVLEADGTVRPCFFHHPIGRTDAGTTLLSILNGPAAVKFRAELDVATNPVCKRCVCSLNWTGAK